MSKKKLVSEDRVITSLQSIRWKCVDLIAEIDKEMDYLEHCKNGKRET